MAERIAFRSFALCAAMSVQAPAALAQDRSDDNAITQAEDAFGFSVGRESIGIYGPGQTRGFSPIAAGNVRVDGLYFDPITGLQGLLVDSTGIKVGLSAQGYPFVAPSGVYDQRLRRPDSKRGGSTLLAIDDWGGRSAEIDVSLPLSDQFAVRAGLNAGKQVFPNGTDNFNHTESLIVRWRPTAQIELVPFWSMYNDYFDESGTFYVPAGDYRGITDRPLHDESPDWADVRFTAQNAGLLANIGLGRNTLVRFGAFRSSVFNRKVFTHLMVDQQPDGSGERILIVDPPTKNRSLSGEVRVTHSIADGPRLHVLHASIRKRDARRAFGGSAEISFGIGASGEKVTDPEPQFTFSETTRQRVEQTTFGIAYNGRWRNVGEISLSLSKADYSKVTRIPAIDPAVAHDRPLLYSGTAAVILSDSASIYAGVARGLEESGTAPQSAANRNEPLDAILTRQKDAGVRFNITKDLKAVVGLFDLRRPYFGFDSANVFRHVGSIRSRGAEFSVSGKLTPQLNVVLGGVFLRPRVQKGDDAQGDIGSKPAGLPTHIVNFNANWASPVSGLQFDMGVSHRGKQPATVDNRVYMRPRLNVNVGTRYSFQLMGKSATLRGQITNLLDYNAPTWSGPGIYGPPGARQVNAFLTVDY
jgi:iron complex outermembrane receptor protein